MVEVILFITEPLQPKLAGNSWTGDDEEQSCYILNPSKVIRKYMKLIINIFPADIDGKITSTIKRDYSVHIFRIT